MRIRKTFQSDRKFDITRTYYILDLEILINKTYFFLFSYGEHNTIENPRLVGTNIYKEQIHTLNLAGKPSFWIIRAY